MKKNTFLLLLILGCPQFLLGQYQLSGTISNTQQQSLAFATIAVYPTTDSTKIRGAITNENGTFIIKNLSPQKYKIVVQMLGYQDWEQKINLTQNTILESIILEEESTTLAAVEVIAQQSTLENRLGKKVLRIGQDLSATGGNALEALDNIPSVSTTQRGQVQIRGNSNVIIYINGKETRRDPATLKYISAEVLEKIEVITNPSAQYDAEGVAGIINLVYKKNKTGTFKLELIANMGWLTNPSNMSPNGGANISFNKKKFSFFTNISLDYSQYQSLDNSTRTNFMDELRFYENRLTLNGKGLTGNYNMGLAFEPDSTLSMGLELNYDRWDFLEKGEQISRFEYANQPNETIALNSQLEELENELWINYSLEKAFQPKQRLKIALSAGGEDEANEVNNEDLDVALFSETFQQFLLQSNEWERQRYYQGKVDFSTPFFNFGQLETGIKADFIDYQILQQAQLRSNTIDLPDNDFTMQLQKLGVYLLQKHQIKKIEYALGLRMEQFSSNALQRADNSTFTQDYLRFFPSVSFNYLLPDNSHTLGFSFTRRINRPSFFDLNPFISYQDPLNLERGNPALRPEIANLTELSYHNELGQLGVDLTVYRRKTKDAIQDVLTAIDNDQTLTTTANLGLQINQGIEGQFTFNQQSAKTTATFVWSQFRFKDLEQTISFDQQTSWNVRLTQQFRIQDFWKIELSAAYRAPRYQAQRKTHEQFYMNASISKKFKNKRGRMILNFRDIFDTRTFLYTLQVADFEVRKNYKWQTRQITLGFRYHIFKG